MAKRLHEFVPITEPGRIAEITNGRLACAMTLPTGTDAERILLDTDRALQLASLAGATLLLLKTHHGDVSETNVSPNGNSNGVGTASATSAKSTAPANEQRVLELAPNSDRYYAPCLMTVSVNTNEVAENIKSQDWPKSIIDEQGWAYNLNKQVTSGLVSAGKEHFISNTSRHDRIMSVWGIGVIAGFGIYSAGDPVTIARISLELGVANNLFTPFFRGPNRGLPDTVRQRHNLSLLPPAFMFDRIAFLALKARRSHLFRVQP